MSPTTRSSISRNHRGMSLIEALMTVLVLAILLAAVLPAMGQLRQRFRLSGVAEMLMTDLQQARSESVLRADAIQFRFSRYETGSCYVIHSGKSGDCQCDREGRAACANSSQLLRVQWIPAQQAMSIRTTASNLSFQARQGTVTPTASIDVVADSGPSIRHIISIAGRVRSCAPQGGVGQLPACRA